MKNSKTFLRVAFSICVALAVALYFTGCGDKDDDNYIPLGTTAGTGTGTGPGTGPGTGTGTVFYVDPASGNMSNDGSYDQPWRTLQEVFEQGFIGTQVQPGDVILLRSGYHGEVDHRNANNSDYITIAAEQGHTPEMRRVAFRNCSKWILRGLTLSPELAPGGYQALGVIGIVRIIDSQDMIIEDNTIYSIADPSGWTVSDWQNEISRGMTLYSSQNLIVRNNTLRNIETGIYVEVDNALVEYNDIQYIAHDGIVGSGNDIILQYNTIKNLIGVLGHPDGIQFHRATNTTTPLINIVIRGNLVVSHDPNPIYPILSRPDQYNQGICSFNCPNINWRVENNIVMTQHWHGIAVFGAVDSVIINNIVFDPEGGYPVWITMGGTGQNSIVRNNIAHDLHEINNTNVVDHNLDIDDYSLGELFVDYSNHDLRHAPGSPAIDVGSVDLAPDTDMTGTSRPQGTGHDIGAYEYAP